MLLDDFSTESFVNHEERTDAGLLRFPDEGSVHPSTVPDLPVARYPTSPRPEDDDGSHSSEAALLQADINALEKGKDALKRRIQENKTNANLTGEAKRATKFLQPKPAEPKDDRKPAAATRSHSQAEAKKKSKKRGNYKCIICGNNKKDHICPSLLVDKRIQTVKTGEEKSDGDQEILVGNDYEVCHLQADDTKTNEQNDSTEDNHDLRNLPKGAKRNSSDTPQFCNDEESLKDTGQGADRSKEDDADDDIAEEPRRGIEEIETPYADSAEDTQCVKDKASNTGNTAQTCHEESSAAPPKRKGDADDTSRLAKRSKNDESPELEDSKETESIGDPVEEPQRNDQETIAANVRSALYVESDEEIETVPV
jgi:hypothetical protein